MHPSIAPAASEADLAIARGLIAESMRAIGQETHDMPSMEQILLARISGEAVGCVALCRIDGQLCEMRRLYVRPRFQGRGIGRKVTEALCGEAGWIGYRKMRFLTLPFMQEARALYRSLGFREVEPYRATTAAGAIFMEGDLDRF